MTYILTKKKICGVVSTSKIIGNKSFTQTGVGFNLNKHPLKTSISLSKILNKNFSILETSSKLIKYLDRKIDVHISTTYLVNYLNRYLLREFKVNHPSFDPNKTEIIKVLNDLSLRIRVNEHYENIFFGELI